VALFLTLLAVGTSLVLDVGAKQSAGIALLGIAFAWAFASNGRLVHWTFAALGWVLVVAPICYNWYDNRGAVRAYESSVTAFERKIPELAKEYPFEKTLIDPQTDSRMGWNGAMWVVVSSGTSTHAIGDEWDGRKWIPEPKTPPWMRKALQGGVNIDAVPYDEKPGFFRPEAFSVSRALVSDWLIELPGLTFICVGIGLLLGVKAN
jgi:hypothetical protein